MRFPAEELFAFLGEHLERVRVAVEEAFVLAPDSAELEACLDDFLDVLIVSDEVFCLYLDGLGVLVVEHGVELRQIEADLLLDVQVVSKQVHFSLL